MRRPSLLLAAVLAVLGASAPDASAQISFGQCPDPGFQAFECATYGVPLDRSGSVPGQIPLFVRRLTSTQGGGAPSRTALVALAGGPGQAATPTAASFAIALAPGLRDRDLLVYDQRGTGRSAPLRCQALQGRQTIRSITRCGQELGAARAFFRTGDSVEDLEALRAAAGYERLAFYGVSYGTKVALEYAARYPDKVERLVLDSVVPPSGPDPLQRSSFRAVRTVLRELCASRSCRGITPDPVADARTLVRRDRTIRGIAYTSGGRRVRVSLEPQDIYEMLVAGDLNPAWRALLPGAVRAAVRGDGTPLARLGLASLGGVSGGGSARLALQRDDAGVNQALFLATACEDIAFPWDRAAGVDARAGQASAALRRQPSSAFSPFDRQTAAGSGVLGQCLGWPNATPAPGPDTFSFPAVPTLVLNGNADLRTPASDAAAVAARIPGAQLVTVPNVGHSVLGADPTGCAAASISGFFTGTVGPCPRARQAVAPTTRPVRSLGSLRPVGNLRGRVGRTVTAVLLTQEDVLVHALGEELAGGRTRFGGLRGGTISRGSAGVTLRKVVVVPGVTVSGRFPNEGDARLSVSGRSAARGTLTLTRAGRITGRLGGRRVRLVPRAQQAAVVDASRFAFRHPGLVAAAR